MAKLIVTIGIPASGKSTWAKTYNKHHKDSVIHSSDEIREEMRRGGKSVGYSKNEHADVFAIMLQRTVNDLKKGHTVIYDATNLNKFKRIQLLDLIRKEVPHCLFECYHFLVSLDVALDRNALREGNAYVPEEVIFSMWRRTHQPVMSEGWDSITIVR